MGAIHENFMISKTIKALHKFYIVSFICKHRVWACSNMFIIFLYVWSIKWQKPYSYVVNAYISINIHAFRCINGSNPSQLNKACLTSKGTLHPSYERIYDYCLVIVQNNGHSVMVRKDWAIYECEIPFLLLKVWRITTFQ